MCTAPPQVGSALTQVEEASRTDLQAAGPPPPPRQGSWAVAFRELRRAEGAVSLPPHPFLLRRRSSWSLTVGLRQEDGLPQWQGSQGWGQNQGVVAPKVGPWWELGWAWKLHYLFSVVGFGS